MEAVGGEGPDEHGGVELAAPVVGLERRVVLPLAGLVVHRQQLVRLARHRLQMKQMVTQWKNYCQTNKKKETNLKSIPIF